MLKRYLLSVSASVVAGVSLLIPLAGFCSAEGDSALGPSVRDVIEFKSIQQPADGNVYRLREQISPDGRRLFILTRKASVVGDFNKYEIQIHNVSPDELSGAHVLGPDIVLSQDVNVDHDNRNPAIKDIKWLDDTTLTYLGRTDGKVYQVYQLDIRSRKTSKLTDGPNSVVSYAVSKSAGRLVYVAFVQNPPLQEGARSIVVGNQSFWSVKFGQNDVRAQYRKYQFFVADINAEGPSKPLGEPFSENNLAPPQVNISPNGRWALLPRYEPERTLAWTQQYPMIEEISKLYTKHADPLNYYSKSTGYAARRFMIWDLIGGKGKTIIDAPDDAFGGSFQHRVDKLWLDNGRSVVLAGTHLPIDKNRSLASHIIQYWPDADRWKVIASLKGRLEEAHAVPGGFAVVDGGKKRQFQRLEEGQWKEVAPFEGNSSSEEAPWVLQIMEDINVPPDIIAKGPGGKTVRLTNLNPQFDAATWGVMKPYAWQDVKGRTWSGGLMMPSNISKKERYPLVIQTYGFSPNRFYLDGPNVHSGFSSGFAGRAFLREGMMVLALPWQPSTGAPKTELEAIRAFADGVRGAVDALGKDGLIDPERVGILGWSATGERVLNLITFNEVSIRSASMMDGDSNTLFSYTISYGAGEMLWKSKEEVNEGYPYGKRLNAWIGRDSSLHTDCVKAAVRIETYGPWVLSNWDIYALLRRQYKAVEMIVIPEGNHSLAQPSERMVSLQGNVDWHGYWLNNRRRLVPMLPAETEASLNAQYAAWQEMKALKADDDKKPSCDRGATAPSQ